MKVYATYKCSKAENGNPITELTPEQKAKLLQKYVEFEIYAKSVQETLSVFKELIAHVFKDGEVHGRYKVINKEVERKQIDTAKVRELLKRIKNGDKYFKTVKYRYLRVVDKDLER